MKSRFRDAGKTLYTFSDLFLVHCPSCGKCARVVLRDGQDGDQSGRRANILFAPRRLVCEHCGHTKDWEGKQVGPDGPYDRYFHLPLWLAMPCCGETLWAYNAEHLRFLEEYVGAELREGSPFGSMVSRLPAWIKSAKNREDVLKCIGKLRDSLSQV